MKRFIRILCFALAVVMMLVAFTACDDKKSRKKKYDSEKDDSSEAPEPVGELIFGTNAEFPPFEFVPGGDGVIGDYDGIDMEIAKRIAEDMNTNPVIENMEFDELILALKNGQVDAVIAGMTIDDERKEEVDFSIPYYNATQVMVVDKASDIKSAADMEDKIIAVINDYTGEYCVRYLGLNGGYAYKTFVKTSDAFLDLKNDKSDVVLIDAFAAEKFVKENEGFKIVEDTEAFGNEQYGIAVKKGNTELLEKINKSLKKMLQDGSIEEFTERHAAFS